MAVYECVGASSHVVRTHACVRAACLTASSRARLHTRSTEPESHMSFGSSAAPSESSAQDTIRVNISRPRADSTVSKGAASRPPPVPAALGPALPPPPPAETPGPPSSAARVSGGGSWAPGAGGLSGHLKVKCGPSQRRHRMLILAFATGRTPLAGGDQTAQGMASTGQQAPAVPGLRGGRFN